jgi:hypothetical protein
MAAGPGEPFVTAAGILGVMAVSVFFRSACFKHLHVGQEPLSACIPLIALTQMLKYMVEKRHTPVIMLCSCQDTRMLQQTGLESILHGVLGRVELPHAGRDEDRQV